MDWKRYWTAWSRHHRSGGFGIHSPYAFQFVRNVWRQPLPYYAFGSIHQLLDTIKAGTTRRQRREMDLISEREARLLFRLTNHFNPRHILQMGASTGVESVTMLEVSHASRLYLFDPQLEQKPLAVRVLRSQLDRVECYDDAGVAIDEFLDAANADETPVIALVNVAIDAGMIFRLLDAGTVLVMRNLHLDKAMQGLFASSREHMSMGQTFTNNKIAILIPNPKLQREDFSLWL